MDAFNFNFATHVKRKHMIEEQRIGIQMLKQWLHLHEIAF